MNPSMRIAVVGCGLIGQKRVQNLPSGAVVVMACDVDLDRARKLASQLEGCRATADYREAVSAPNVDAVIVATLNASLAPVAAEAMRANKHVLVEKPVGIHARELDVLDQLARKNRICARAGYNHRYHPACLKALELWRSGELGPLMFLRGRYGQGGRIGYEKEWRANPQLSGGGELIDQGVHLIDLAGIFLGDIAEVTGHLATYFWKMPVEDKIGRAHV